MTDRQLLQQALDALEESVDLVRHEYSIDWRHGLSTRKAQLEGMKAGLDAHDAAITALRERLAHCDRCGKKLGGEGDIHTCSPRLDQGPDYERGFVDGMSRQAQSSVDRAVNRMAQPEQEPVATVQCIKGITIDPVTGNVGIGTPAQPAQQEVDWKDQYEKQKRRADMWVAKYEKDIGPIEYAAPAAQQEPHIQFMSSDELKPRTPAEKKAYLQGVVDGKMYAVRDGLATPPAAQRLRQEPVVSLPYHPCTAILIAGLKDLHAWDVLHEWDKARKIVDDGMVAAAPPAAQRKPQYNKTEMNCFVQDLYDQKMREGKHGHYETMFHVVHRAIEAAHGIKENT
jgi:hypothetical protein